MTNSLWQIAAPSAQGRAFLNSYPCGMQAARSAARIADASPPKAGARALRRALSASRARAASARSRAMRD